jgi:phosphonate transport system substrate-binding protein
MCGVYLWNFVMPLPKDELTLVTCQAANTIPISRAIASYLSQQLSIPVRFIENIKWQDAYQGIAGGEIDIGWICGRPYAQLVDEIHAPIRLLTAPVMHDPRYHNRPIYFSDVIVRHDSPYTKFEDLRGRTWAYNEPSSQSGYHITCYNLSTIGEDAQFFGHVIESGSHSQSIDMVMAGKVDASAIDSTLLEWLIKQDSSLRKKLRIIDTWGPSPIPPLVINSSLGEDKINAIQNHLLELENSAAGRKILSAGLLRRFSKVIDNEYNPIREMASISSGIRLESR